MPAAFAAPGNLEWETFRNLLPRDALQGLRALHECLVGAVWEGAVGRCPTFTPACRAPFKHQKLNEQVAAAA